MKFIAIIPARYASTRFPGKPLAMLDGQYIIQRVYNRVSPLVEDTFVATDDERIYKIVESFGGRAIMTSTSHRSGTDRCWEAVSKAGPNKYDVVINIQGDEPFIHPSQIESVKECFLSPDTQIATLVKPFEPTAKWEDLENPNSPKVVVGKQGQALYFSRSIVPYLRGVDRAEWIKQHTFYKHIGLYAYRTQVLHEITQLEPGVLEKAESLEQLRWLENGYNIKVGITHTDTIGIDTPEDLLKAEQFLKKQNNHCKTT